MRHRRSFQRFALMLAALVAASGCTQSGGNSQSSREVLIGAPAALSGDFSAFSARQFHAAELAVAWINEHGGIESLDGAKLRLVSADTQSDPARAGQLLRQLAASNELAAFIGPMTSFEAKANLPIIDQLGIPFLTLGGDDELTAFGSESVFRMINGSTFWSSKVQDFLGYVSEAKETPIQRVAVVTTQTAPGPNMGEVLAADAEQAGYEVERFSYDDKATPDFAPLVSRIAEMDPDVVVGYQNLGDGIQFAKAVVDRAWKPKLGYVWVGGAQYQTEFKKNLGEAVNGWIDASYTGGWEDGNFGDAVKEISEKFSEKYGEMGPLDASQLAMIAAIAQALEDAGSSDPEDVREALTNIDRDSTDFSTPLFAQYGGLKFDENRDNARWIPAFVQLRGDFDQVIVYPAEQATAEIEWPIGQ